VNQLKANQKIEVKPMSQTLRTQFSSIVSMDGYRRQNSFDPPQSHLSSAKRSRNRGVFLSQQGRQKLTQAGVLYNELGQRYTYEQLSERSLLDMRTVSRLLSCEVKVDKNTLKTFFRAFNLILEAGDYILSQSDGANDVEPAASDHTILIVQRVEFEQLVEELHQLKQCIRKYDRLLQQLGLNEDFVSQQLRA
jgi:transcriptional regulator with XRE-family HTH domain